MITISAHLFYRPKIEFKDVAFQQIAVGCHYKKNSPKGFCFQGSADRCSTVRNLLIEGFEASPTVKKEFESPPVVTFIAFP
jgi:hypothetical protein